MNKNVALLSIGTTLSLSLFIVDLGHAVHIDRTRQYTHTRMAADVTEAANLRPIQVSNAPDFCEGDGMRRSAAPCLRPTCLRPSLPGPGDRATDGAVYTSIAITATLILTLVVLLCLVSLSRRISQPPWVKSTQ
jgi:hypothetical protein